MNLPEFLESATELGCSVEKSMHKGVFLVTINELEKFIVGDMRDDAAYQLYRPGNSLPTRGKNMTYTEAVQKIRESKSAA